ncbi:hypothetical protein [Streptomyces goshikiensis]
MIGESAVAALVGLLESPEGARPGELTVPAGLTVRASSGGLSGGLSGRRP